MQSIESFSPNEVTASKAQTFIGDLPLFHQERIICWKAQDVSYQQENFLALVEKNHAFNYQLWAMEDRARRDDLGFEFVYQAKRAIDQYNQQRNDYIEKMDEWLFELLKPEQENDCPLHSETPGMMIDRLSILALKAYHMALQTERSDVDEMHRQLCQNKLQMILTQQKHLFTCLLQLIEEMIQGKRSFVFFRAFKMYNDPRLNPELYDPKK